jgi:hypothetical protein
MRKWLPLIKEIRNALLGLGFLSFITWFGLAEIYRVVTTGELLARFGGRGERGYTRLISFETSPVNFVLGVALHLVMAGLGLYFWFLLWRKARLWWDAKP